MCVYPFIGIAPCGRPSSMVTCMKMFEKSIRKKINAKTYNQVLSRDEGEVYAYFKKQNFMSK